MEITKGNNFLNSRSIFIERKKYDELFPESVIRKIDLWDEKTLFGKVDRFNNPIILKNQMVRQISVDNNVYAVNFLADAFFQIKREFKEKERRKRINLDGSVFTDLEPKKGFISVEVEYSKFLNLLYSSFGTFLQQNQNYQRLVDFSSFFILFKEFLTNLSNGLFFTKSSFILSKYCSPLCSGLMLEISNNSHSQDEEKVKKFINDRNFNFYQKTAKKYGFYLDKNAPWRLIANVNSPQMKEFMIKFGFKDKDDLFDRGYEKTSQNEFQQIKEIMVRFYNSYVFANPILVVRKRKCAEKILRQTINLDDVEKLINKNSLISFYAWLKSKESVSLGTINIENLDGVIEKSISIASVLGEEKAIAFINSQYKVSTEQRDAGSGS